ncbi:hypothetical protein DFA_06162 [Cavenderia fasciculata]|uniref:Uncharacterized protein n=1 Tax=Cavenderia fasciculata TaxID=261658 RepID=F4PKA0_CACFS|nr:uncharacterized protein DFA_06162 [Cavenderia fasciculata]EGG24024.1 hypothetical protein DFA_06162 [Cavenderia fasciculata]|eukprot:XP_004361875.1 hypothetical protein DFA_06162 [Cavenderia fasciculata]
MQDNNNNYDDDKDVFWDEYEDDEDKDVVVPNEFVNGKDIESDPYTSRMLYESSMDIIKGREQQKNLNNANGTDGNYVYSYLPIFGGSILYALKNYVNVQDPINVGRITKDHIFAEKLYINSRENQKKF